MTQPYPLFLFSPPGLMNSSFVTKRSLIYSTWKKLGLPRGIKAGFGIFGDENQKSRNISLNELRAEYLLREKRRIIFSNRKIVASIPELNKKSRKSVELFIKANFRRPMARFWIRLCHRRLHLVFPKIYCWLKLRPNNNLSLEENRERLNRSANIIIRFDLECQALFSLNRAIINHYGFIWVYNALLMNLARGFFLYYFYTHAVVITYQEISRFTTACVSGFISVFILQSENVQIGLLFLIGGGLLYPVVILSVFLFSAVTIFLKIQRPVFSKVCSVLILGFYGSSLIAVGVFAVNHTKYFVLAQIALIIARQNQALITGGVIKTND